MVLVHHDAVVVLATCITAATGVLAVLANTAMASTDVATLLAVLAQPCGMAKKSRGGAVSVLQRHMRGFAKPQRSSFSQMHVSAMF